MACWLLISWLILVTSSRVTTQGMEQRNSEGLDKGLSPVVHSSWFVFWDNQGCSFSSVFLIFCPKVGEKCS